MKICSLYGAGFYYVPGTDMCLKIGGYVRQQVGWGVNGSLTDGGNVASLDTRSTQNFAMRARGYITADARNQTEYGTVRSYIAVGVSGNPDPGSGASNTFSANRAFIQFAGFTFGITQSFYDFYSGPATSFFGGNINPSSDTGDGGKQVTSYTAQFGGGLSATIGIEGQRQYRTYNATSAATLGSAPNALPTNSARATQYPDVVANVRIDQAWGGAQIMGAIHDATGLYNGATTSTGQQGTATGYALGVGLKLLAPMIGAGDYFQGQFNYTVGAAGYTNGASAPMYAKYNGGAGGSYGFGIISDGVYSATTGVQLTTTWNVNAAYEHFWNKSWQTSVYGGYAKTEYNSTANALMCASQTIVTGFTSCNMNFAVWNIGSRTQWNIDSQTAMGVDIVYQRINSAQFGGPTTVTGVSTQPTAVRSISDQGSWMGQFRIHRNFYP